MFSYKEFWDALKAQASSNRKFNNYFRGFMTKPSQEEINCNLTTGGITLSLITNMKAHYLQVQLLFANQDYVHCRYYLENLDAICQLFPGEAIETNRAVSPTAFGIKYSDVFLTATNRWSEYFDFFITHAVLLQQLVDKCDCGYLKNEFPMDKFNKIIEEMNNPEEDNNVAVAQPTQSAVQEAAVAQEDDADKTGKKTLFGLFGKKNKADGSRVVESDITMKAVDEEAAKKAAEEEARRKAAEEAAKKAAEEAAKKAAEEAAKKAAEEEARKKAEEEARKKAEEEARKKAEEEARKKAEEEARRKAAEEARKAAEEVAKKAAEEAKKATDDLNSKQSVENTAKENFKAAEEARKVAEEAKKVAEEAAKKAAEAVKKATEEVNRRVAEENAAKKAIDVAHKGVEEARKIADKVGKKAEEAASKLAALVKSN